MQLSIVTTLYKSSAFIREFHSRITEVASSLFQEFEVVFVDDGSPDDSLLVAKEIQLHDSRVRIIELSRNFGHHQAIWTGLQHAQGKLVFLIDSDLEEAPELLRDFFQELSNKEADVVYGVAKQRNGSFFKKWGGILFYKIFNVLADVQIPQNLLTIRLMTRPYLNALLSHKENSFAISGLWARTGFKQNAFLMEKGARDLPSYSFFKRLKMVVNTITAFSSKPLIMGFYFGVIFLLLSIIGVCKLVVERLFYSSPPEGWTFLAVSVWGIGGLVLFCQGVQGIYLAKIFMETKRRPIAFIRKIHGIDSRSDRDIQNVA